MTFKPVCVKNTLGSIFFCTKLAAASLPNSGVILSEVRIRHYFSGFHLPYVNKNKLFQYFFWENRQISRHERHIITICFYICT